MAHKNKVMQSINLRGESVCFDVFLRPDGTYGFDEFRRDPEDYNGWYSIGHYGHQVINDEAQALDMAIESIHWLSREMTKPINRP